MEEKAVLENGGDNYALVHFLLVINLLRIGREQYTWTRNSSLISSTNAQSDRRRDRGPKHLKKFTRYCFGVKLFQGGFPWWECVCIRERRMNIERNKYRVYIWLPYSCVTAWKFFASVSAGRASESECGRVRLDSSQKEDVIDDSV